MPKRIPEIDLSKISPIIAGAITPLIRDIIPAFEAACRAAGEQARWERQVLARPIPCPRCGGTWSHEPGCHRLPDEMTASEALRLIPQLHPELPAPSYWDDDTITDVQEIIMTEKGAQLQLYVQTDSGAELFDPRIHSDRAMPVYYCNPSITPPDYIKQAATEQYGADDPKIVTHASSMDFDPINFAVDSFETAWVVIEPLMDGWGAGYNAERNVLVLVPIKRDGYGDWVLDLERGNDDE